MSLDLSENHSNKSNQKKAIQCSALSKKKNTLAFNMFDDGFISEWLNEQINTYK